MSSNNAKYFKSEFGSFIKVGSNQDTTGRVVSVKVSSDGDIDYDPSDLDTYGNMPRWTLSTEAEFTNAYNKAMIPFREFMSTAVRNY